MAEIRVAIFEDHKLVREAFEAILNGTDGYTCCGAYSSGANWLQDIKRSNPDVVLMDIEMPGKDGIELSGLISQSFPEIKILIQNCFLKTAKKYSGHCAQAHRGIF